MRFLPLVLLLGLSAALASAAALDEDYDDWFKTDAASNADYTYDLVEDDDDDLGRG